MEKEAKQPRGQTSDRLEMVVLDVIKTEHRCGHPVGEGEHGDRGATKVSHSVSSLSVKGRHLVCSLGEDSQHIFQDLMSYYLCAPHPAYWLSLLFFHCAPPPNLGALQFQGECAPMRICPCRIPVYCVPSSLSKSFEFLDVECSGVGEVRVHVLVEGWGREQWPEGWATRKKSEGKHTFCHQECTGFALPQTLQVACSYWFHPFPISTFLLLSSLDWQVNCN